MNLTYPVSTEEPAVAGRGRMVTATDRLSFESAHVNMGDSSNDGKGSGSRELETAPKTPEVLEGSQRGHSTRRTCAMKR